MQEQTELDDRLKLVKDARGNDTNFTYDSNHYILTVNDRTSQTWTYEWFSNGQLKKVTDPVFNYVASLTYSTQKINNLWRTTFTDRRSKIWKFYHDDDGNRREAHTPLSEVWTYTFDTDHNVLTAVNPLSKTWTMTWRPVGNLLTQSTPISTQTWTLAWLAPSGGEPDDFYGLTQVTDPADHWGKSGDRKSGDTIPISARVSR